MDCGTIEDEGIRVDNLDDDDNACCWEPATGMCFSCLEEVKSFYEEYASRKGFGWKIRSSRKRQDGEPCYLILSCSREGSKVSKISCTLKTLPIKVNNCPAKIVIKLDKDGLWNITKFEPDHTHETSHTKASKTFQSLVKDARGHENVPFCETDVRNYVNKERHAIGKEGDGKALISYFCQIREQNSDFFYDIDLDDDFHVRNVFWADARSRAAYEYFGNVVTFDTTYLTNKYDMPFVAFVGVNHHGQSTLLGCGLLSGEDTYSFVWLFKSWLHCMLGNAPLGIVTDQCKAMKNAIELVFPTTRHRWCL
ncbi:protein FAR1-RELATED SEQUENCE 5-like [Cicer arietinum]|uniref:Protein FAR1-RELATED SEQUENCE 5-like n=1 Tax=Cicer arietinum TaxID=3827 RepID=A0A1S2Z6K1_CICAR|nr:protein FAR1-RELATED SEQUENCE 5-like [Cicer arietinum]